MSRELFWLSGVVVSIIVSYYIQNPTNKEVDIELQKLKKEI